MKEYFPVTDPKRIAFYRTLMSHPVAQKRAMALLSIDPNLIDDGMIEILTIMLNDKSVAIAENAARLLAETGLTKAADSLFTALNEIEDGDAKMLATELSSMGTLGYERLEKCAESPNPDVRGRVASTILRTRVPTALSVVKALQNDESKSSTGARVCDLANRAITKHERLQAKNK